MLKKPWGRSLSLVVFLVIVSSVPARMAGREGGTTWDVFPEMSRESIQSVFDTAMDGDLVLFHAGDYDWTAAPLVDRTANEGAINIVEKSLTIKGEAGARIIGPPSLNPLGQNPMGVNAFFIEDLDQDDDVTFQGLVLESFLRGFSCWHMAATVPEDVSRPNLRNLTVLDCDLRSIHRDGITIGEIGGDVLVQNNTLNAGRCGLYVSWYWSEGHAAWQPEGTFIRIVGNRIPAAVGLIAYRTTNLIVRGNDFLTTSVGMTIVDTQAGAVISENAIGTPEQSSLQGIYLGGQAVGAVVEKNTLENLTSYGIMILGAESSGNTIRGNTVWMRPASYAGLYSFGHNDYLGQNRIAGAGRYAVCLMSNAFGDVAHHETLQANNVNQFSPLYAHFYLRAWTHDNLIVGSGMEVNTLIDLGVDNRITGITPVSGGVGDDLSEAVGMRNEELREARDIKH